MNKQIKKITEEIIRELSEMTFDEVVNFKEEFEIEIKETLSERIQQLCETVINEVLEKKKRRCESINIPEEIRISQYQPVVFSAGTELEELYDAIIKFWGFDKDNYQPLIASVFYNLGIAHGKRKDRARRKEYHGTVLHK